MPTHGQPRTSDASGQQQQPAQHALTQTSTALSVIQYPAGLKLFLIMLSVLVSMFLVALDRLVIATAVPQITDHFHSVTDIGWYGSAYLLTTCAFQLLFGKFYAFFRIKHVYLVSVLLFEVGSAVCGAAPSSAVFIVGRAIAGVGGGGIFSGTIIIMVYSVPLHRRPKYQGAFEAVFSLASVWNNPRIIILLVFAAVLIISFVVIQILIPETATVPPRIMRQRSIAFASWAAFTIGGQMMIFAYFLPIYFQAIQGVSAVDSGIRTLPLVLSMMMFAVVSGQIITKIGYYTPVMLVGTCIMIVGAGLLTTLKVDSGAGHWIGFQVLYGAGMGMTYQAPNLAAQTVLKMKDVPIGTSVMFFSQTLGGATFLSVGQNVFNNELMKRLRGLPGLEGIDIKGSGVTTLTKLPAEIRGSFLEAYNQALRVVFVVGLVLVCVVLIGAGGMEWKSVKWEQATKKKTQEDAEAGVAATAGVAVVAPVVDSESDEGQKRSTT
ncbi:MFS aflatoxin efflux transporter [Colletotrichum tabaci]|uniref:MFS aflatoxin efflux transporter n=1 Tax=Colletotrichum tabaci TaxID=1209068 RepID=A0AAV9SVE1_9PEZI